ncbi:MobF family relaxase [Flavobacterium sp. TBRC 19031]|uniref:MobF family relaxase n=1 Tax=Flavobacterium mekongense TaxID=3379707 RepID=UPI00399B2E11
MIQSQSAGHAKAYFSDALMKSDYYVSDQELQGFWQGLLAVRLGLQDSGMKDAFFALCENVNPQTGHSLTPRTKDVRKVGYDINFHCPKSVSILHGLSGDDHILKAFQDSVTETMRSVEADAKTRVRLDGQQSERGTSELAWSHFTHQTARPVDGALPDPHLHSHCFVFNATWDEAEQRIKAGEFRDIKRDMPYYQAIFHKTLSDKLVGLGYGIKRTETSFEIEGVPQKVIDLFSKRTDEIGRIAKEKGITDAKELAELGARSRAKKQKGHSMTELRDEWLSQIAALGNTGDEGKAVRYAPDRQKEELTAEQCLDHAIAHSFERASVMADRKLLEAAYRHAIGRDGVSLNAIAKRFREDKRLIHITENARPMCTTKEVLTEEKRMVDLARLGKGLFIPLYEKAPELDLTGQQKTAVEHVLTTSDRVSIVRGAAGAGKTTLMREAVAKVEQAGKAVTVLAPTAQASRGVLREEGFGDAQTVAKFLTDAQMQEKLKGQVLWVDEAGLLGTKDMTDLLEIVTKQGARLILGGDTRQHASVVRGDAMRILNTVAGIRSAEVSKIYRQKNHEYKAAVEDLSKGDIKEAFGKLDNMGAIVSVDPMKPNEQMVKGYIDTLKKGKSAIVISPTHAQGEEATNEIRQKMKEEGLLGKKEIAAKSYKRLNLTEAEKADARNYQNGQIVKFNQNVSGFMRGSIWAVEKENDQIRLVNEKGQCRTLPIGESHRYSLYHERQIKLSKGDKVMITDNSFDAKGRRLNNGTLLEVAKVSATGKLTLQNEVSKCVYELDKKFGFISHAHVITSYASQGKTVDEVFIYQPAGTFPATDAKQFYVSVSRGRDRARIYTDDKETLLEYASELGIRQSAIELVGKDKNHIDAVMQLQRQEKEQGINHQQSKDYEPDR